MNHNFYELLQEVTAALAAYLEKELPNLYKDWWKDAVIESLSFQQQQRVIQYKINNLSSLDLAALLRVFDQNWYQISSRFNLLPEARHYVKEMQTIRNRWAHASADEFQAEDIYRDLDTLQRFAAAIGAEEAFLQEIRDAKSEQLADQKSKHFPQDTTAQLGPNFASSEFEPGQIVFLKSNPATRGAVVSVQSGQPETRYKIFVNGEIQTFYASQLQLEVEEEEAVLLSSLYMFHSYLTSRQILYPGLSTLYSVVR